MFPQNKKEMFKNDAVWAVGSHWMDFDEIFFIFLVKERAIFSDTDLSNRQVRTDVRSNSSYLQF